MSQRENTVWDRLLYAHCHSSIQPASEFRKNCYLCLFLSSICSSAQKNTNLLQYRKLNTYRKHLMSLPQEIPSSASAVSARSTHHHRHSKLQMFHHSCKHNMATGTKSLKRSILHLIHTYFVIFVQTRLKMISQANNFRQPYAPIHLHGEMTK